MKAGLRVLRQEQAETAGIHSGFLIVEKFD
jgi:hypothetical protein